MSAGIELRDALARGLAPLAAFPQFILYHVVWNGAKWDKIPIDWRTLRAASAHEAANWLPAQHACNVADMMGAEYGVGFTFTAADPFMFVDIDNCLMPDGAAWSPLAHTLLGAFAGAYVEISLSGKGLHIIGSYASIPAHACKNTALGLELYHEGRFVALTGKGASGSAAAIIG